MPRTAWPRCSAVTRAACSAAMGLRFAENILYYIVVTFSITYLSTQLKMDTSNILLLLLVAHHPRDSGALDGPVHGQDRPTPRVRSRCPHGHCVVFVAFPMFNTETTGSSWPVVLDLAIHAFMYAGQPAIMAEMFPTRMRYSGVSLGYRVTSIVAGSLAPSSPPPCCASSTRGFPFPSTSRSRASSRCSPWPRCREAGAFRCSRSTPEDRRRLDGSARNTPVLTFVGACRKVNEHDHHQLDRPGKHGRTHVRQPREGGPRCPRFRSRRTGHGRSSSRKFCRPSDSLEHVLDGEQVVFTMLPRVSIRGPCISGTAVSWLSHPKDALLIDSSTIDVETAVDLHKAAAEAVLRVPGRSGVPEAMWCGRRNLDVHGGRRERRRRKIGNTSKPMAERIVHTGRRGPARPRRS